jgi:hypothetical protein
VTDLETDRDSEGVLEEDLDLDEDLVKDGVFVIDLVPVDDLELDRVPVGDLVMDRVTEIVLDGDFDFLDLSSRAGPVSDSSISSSDWTDTRRNEGGTAPKNPATNSSWLRSANWFNASVYVLLPALCA